MSDSKYYRWYDEPGSIRIRLEKGYLEGLTCRAIDKAGSLVNLSRATGLSKATIHNYKTEASLTIRGLKLILNVLRIKYDRINHRIVGISWAEFNFNNIRLDSAELSVLLAASLADGHISQTHFMYKNKDPSLIKKVKNAVWTTFGKEIVINDRIAKNGVPYILCPSIIKRQLERLGSPKGKKLFINPRVPKIVRYGTIRQKISFIRQFFDDEGWPDRTKKVACSQCSDTTIAVPKSFLNKMIIRIDLKKKDIPKQLLSKIIKPNLLEDIQEILCKEFNIKTNLQLKKITKYLHKKKGEYVSATWELVCHRKADIMRFKKEIGFYSTKKQRVLKEILVDKPLPKYINRDILNVIIRLHKNQGAFSVRDLQKSIPLESRRIRKRLQTLSKHNIISNDNGEYRLNLEL